MKLDDLLKKKKIEIPRKIKKKKKNPKNDLSNHFMKLKNE